jgi:hypothetical protein
MQDVIIVSVINRQISSRLIKKNFYVTGRVEGEVEYRQDQ